MKSPTYEKRPNLAVCSLGCLPYMAMEANMFACKCLFISILCFFG